MKYIIFDYDGTLHNSIRIYEPAFKRAYDYLVNNGYAEEKVFKEDEVSRFLGLTARQMWNDFMPSLPEDEKKKCSSIIGEAMIQYIDEGQAELYDGTIETLVKLNELGYKLIFLSNCKVSYMKKHIEQMKEAIYDGVELIAYTSWGCTDVVSASTGEVRKRYGLIYVNKHDDGSGDLSRMPKDSFYWYKKVIESNGEDL